MSDNDTNIKSMEKTTYKIHESLMDTFVTKIDNINKKLNGHGSVSYTVLSHEKGEYIDEDGKECSGTYFNVAVDGFAKFEDYEFVAEVKPQDNDETVIDYKSSVVKNYKDDMSDRLIDFVNSHDPLKCDCCNAERKDRKMLYIFKDKKSDKFVQLGSSCVKKYTNGISGEDVALFVGGFANLMPSKSAGLQNMKPKYVDTRRFLQYAYAVAQTDVDEAIKYASYRYSTRYGNGKSQSKKADKLYNDLYDEFQNSTRMCRDENGIADTALELYSKIECDYPSDEKTNKTNKQFDKFRFIQSLMDSGKFNPDSDEAAAFADSVLEHGVSLDMVKDISAHNGHVISNNDIVSTEACSNVVNLADKYCRDVLHSALFSSANFGAAGKDYGVAVTKGKDYIQYFKDGVDFRMVAGRDMPGFDVKQLNRRSIRNLLDGGIEKLEDGTLCSISSPSPSNRDDNVMYLNVEEYYEGYDVIRWIKESEKRYSKDGNGYYSASIPVDKSFSASGFVQIFYNDENIRTISSGEGDGKTGDHINLVFDKGRCLNVRFGKDSVVRKIPVSDINDAHMKFYAGSNSKSGKTYGNKDNEIKDKPKPEADRQVLKKEVMPDTADSFVFGAESTFEKQHDKYYVARISVDKSFSASRYATVCFSENNVKGSIPAESNGYTGVNLAFNKNSTAGVYTDTQDGGRNKVSIKDAVEAHRSHILRQREYAEQHYDLICDVENYEQHKKGDTVYYQANIPVDKSVSDDGIIRVIFKQGNIVPHEGAGESGPVNLMFKSGATLRACVRKGKALCDVGYSVPYINKLHDDYVSGDRARQAEELTEDITGVGVPDFDIDGEFVDAAGV